MYLEEFVNLFLYFEYKNRMFAVKINNVHIWHYIRSYVYDDLLKIHDFGDFLTNVSYNNNKSSTSLKDIFRKYIGCNQFLAHKRDILIIPHERKYKDNGQYYKCIYTHLLDQYLVNSHYILDNKSLENKYELQKSRNILYGDIERFNKIKKSRFPYISVAQSEVNGKIIEPIEKYFDISIDLEVKKKWFNVIKDCLNGRKYWVRYYNYMLNKIKPKLILMVVSYAFNRMILCEVAKKRNIPVVELQHGTINRNVIIYNFYKRMKLPSFPDYIFTFGQFEKENARFPIEKARIIPVGYPELEKNIHLYKKNKKGKKMVLFISQGLTEIAEYANAAAQKLDAEKYYIVYKLHPKEYFNWKSNIGKHLHHPNVEVVGSFGNTVHEFLAQADWVVGNYSTVLYEAQMFDAKVIVLKFGLYQNAEYLYMNKYALLVNSPEQLIREIEEDAFQPNKEISLFEKNSLEKMQVNINSIINLYQKS